MTGETQAASRSDYRLWQVIAWVSFAVLAVCVARGLLTVFPRVDAINEVLDDPAGAPQDSSHRLGDSLDAARLSLLIGTPAALTWIVARVMCHRARREIGSA